MSGPPAAVAAVRVAVRAALRPYAERGRGGPPAAGGGPLVLVACSGGADSLALAAAAAFVAPRLGMRAGLVTVDHGLQEGSAERAAALAAWARGRGLAPVDVAAVAVAGPGGPEAAARAARYAALEEAAVRRGAAAVLLGHSRDDQAETVLLALARGAGPRGLAGMPAARPLGATTLLRPLLGLPRATLARSCADQDLTPWVDPHNADPAYARSRVRARLLPALAEVLGEKVVANLARTAALVAADNAALDALAADALAAARAGGA
ncbi:MAG TPA: tRNA lysidine(34) synthetase TilS, partial [Pilimelia sp.]|nr:tRNA lysidine(34) synthetase TilS [Pilimelia sp.]